MKEERRNGKKNRIRKVCIVLVWLLLWQVAALAVDNELLLAGPLETGKALCTEVVNPVFWQTIAATLTRVIGGFTVAFALGCLLAALGSKWKSAADFLAPLMLFCKAVPVACFAVILLIWWGAGLLSFAICFLVTLPIIYTNVYEGLRSTDKKLLEMAKVFRMSGLHKIFYIYRPAVAPFFESGIKTALGMSIKAGVAAEVIGLADKSIGGEIYMSKIYLDIAGVFAWTLVVIVLGALLEKGALFLCKAFLAWKPVFKHRSLVLNKKPQIQVEHITKCFDGHTVLSDVNKTMGSERVYCLMAPSGAGKTTLLHILAGLVKPDTGSAALGVKVSMVFQEDRLCEEESALKNVEIVCADREKARKYLTELLPDGILQPVNTLSGGMRRRVCIARALAAESELLLFDEPFNGLDEACMKKTAEMISRNKGERILVAATHHKEEVSCLNGEIWNIPMS